MKLQGSCHCASVRFELESAHPYPFMRCYCSICRKTAGAGGYAINLAGDNRTLKVTGKKHVGVYRARMAEEKSGKTTYSSARRHFCKQCGSPLWLWDPNWPDLVHPHASAIDTELPVPPEHTHMMLGSKAMWVEVEVEAKPRDRRFDEYPEESIADWHQRLGLERRNQDDKADN
ncbi:MAG: GFA family protein [Gammaproteobacteria bacterium]